MFSLRRGGGGKGLLVTLSLVKASSTVGPPGLEPVGLEGLEALDSVITLAASLGPSLCYLSLLPLRLAFLPVLPLCAPDSQI